MWLREVKEVVTNIDSCQVKGANRSIHVSFVSELLHLFSVCFLRAFTNPPLRPLYSHLPLPLFLPLCVPYSPQFTGFPGHIVASQWKLAQHSAVNNWRGPTWPGTLSLNGLFWERSMPACEGFIRTCRWNVQGHCQWSLSYVLIQSRCSMTIFCSSSFLSPAPKYWFLPNDDPPLPPCSTTRRPRLTPYSTDQNET